MDELVAAGTPIVTALDRLEQASASGDTAAFDDALAEITARTREAAAVSSRIGMSACYAPDGP